MVPHEYVLITRQPVIYEDIGDHELLAIAENAQAALMLYQERLERSRVEILRRTATRESLDIPDPDFHCDVVAPGQVFIGWRDGKSPWSHKTKALAS